MLIVKECVRTDNPAYRHWRVAKSRLLPDDGLPGSYAREHLEKGEYRAIMRPNEIQMCGAFPTSKQLAKTACLPVGQKSKHSP